MRYICFDTETTGLSVVGGDRVFEIGCVEIVDRKKTGKTFQQYLNPERALSNTSKEICKITDEDLTDKPVFAKVFKDFLGFLKQDEKTILIAHNAKFDVTFLNNELDMVKAGENLNSFTVIDTLMIARTKFPGQAASLNALCKKFDVDLSGRESKGHGALLDSDILADVFLQMCAADDDDTVRKSNQEECLFFGFHKRATTLEARIFDITQQAELEAHKEILGSIGARLW